MKPCKNSAFFLDVFLDKLSAEFQAFFKNQGGEIVVWSWGSRLVSGNYHEDLGPVASLGSFSNDYEYEYEIWSRARKSP
jgi:hypothetical protein